jgi:hypothetical protein
MPEKTAKHKKTKKWFIATRGSYLPNTWQGALTYIPYVAYLFVSGLVVLKHPSPNIVKIFEIIAIWIAAAAIMTWFARRLAR